MLYLVNLTLPRSPQQQPATEQEQGQQEYHEGVAHDLAHVQARDRQQGDGPEGLDHVGPLVAVGDGQDDDGGVDTEVLSRFYEYGALHRPLAAA